MMRFTSRIPTARPQRLREAALRPMPTLETMTGDRLSISLRPSPPFDFALTARVLRRSTRNLIDRVEGVGTWTRVVVLSGRLALLGGMQHGAQGAFDAAPARAEARRAIEAFVTRLFSLDIDLALFWRRVRREPEFAQLTRRCVG